MMKKILVLLMVLGLCGAAHATVVSLVDEGTIISTTPGGVVKLEITSDTSLAVINSIAAITGPGTISGAMNLGDCGAYGWDPTLSMDPIYVGLTVEVGGGTMGAARVGPAAYLEVTYTGPGPVIVSMVGDGTKGGTFDGSYMPVTYSQGIVEIIPEPATIALLGLGGLALLRRRKK